jgi:hypothetical protein
MSAALYARKSTEQHRGVSARGNRAGVMVTAIGYVRRSKESGARTVSLEDRGARIADFIADSDVRAGLRERRRARR